MKETTPITASISRAYAAAKGSLALFGLVVLIAVVLVPAQGVQYLRQIAVEPFSEPATETAGTIQTAAGPSAGEVEQRALAEFIAKRWRIAEAAASSFVSIAYRAGATHKVDPVLILAVMAIESRYNPVAESDMGAVGLMQVIPKFHLEKLMDHGGEAALLDPEVNIHVGAQILREYQRRFQDTETALQMYAGAFDEPTSRYANKVFDEKARLDLIRWKARRQTGQSA